MRRRLQVPDYPPVERRTALDAIFETLPYRSKHGRLTIDRVIVSSPAAREATTAVRVRRLLMFGFSIGDVYFEISLPVGRPKFGEHWSPEREPWIANQCSDDCDGHGEW